MSLSPAVILYNADGTAAVTVQQDGSVHRLQVGAYLTGQIDPVRVTGSLAPGDLSTLVRELLQDGGSDDLRVDGSTAPVHFDFDCDPTEDISLFEIRLMLTTADFTLDAAHFGSRAALPNGLRIAVTSDGTETELGLLKINEEFFLLPFAAIVDETTGPKDYMAIAMQLGGAVKLLAGTSDRVRVTVQDDISESARFEFFKAAVLGVKG